MFVFFLRTHFAFSMTVGIILKEEYKRPWNVAAAYVNVCISGRAANKEATGDESGSLGAKAMGN